MILVTVITKGTAPTISDHEGHSYVLLEDTWYARLWKRLTPWLAHKWTFQRTATGDG